MLQKLQAKRDEEGFTLIELLVVIIIIGILAAIAIPVFLNQRNKGYDSAIKADLRNAATAQETVLTEAGEYTDVVASLQSAGFKYSTNTNYAGNTQGLTVVLTAVNGIDAQEYCMSATSKSGTEWKYDSPAGLTEGAC